MMVWVCQCVYRQTYPTMPCTHVTCSQKLVKGSIYLDWEFPPQRLQEVLLMPCLPVLFCSHSF